MPDASRILLLRNDTFSNERVLVQAFWILTFAVLVAAGAQIEIPTRPVPFTFQTFFVLLAGGFLGKRNGFFSMTLYLILGTAGLPAFAGGGAGMAHLLGPTGGYLLSFPLAAFLVGYLISFQPAAGGERVTLLEKLAAGGWTVASMTLGLLVVFLAGTAQLQLVYFHNWEMSFRSGFLIFSLWDLLKLFAAAAIYQGVARKIN